jgi:hypothetical protein
VKGEKNRELRGEVFVGVFSSGVGSGRSGFLLWRCAAERRKKGGTRQRRARRRRERSFLGSAAHSRATLFALSHIPPAHHHNGLLRDARGRRPAGASAAAARWPRQQRACPAGPPRRRPALLRRRLRGRRVHVPVPVVRGEGAGGRACIDEDGRWNGIGCGTARGIETDAIGAPSARTRARVGPSWRSRSPSLTPPLPSSPSFPTRTARLLPRVRHHDSARPRPRRLGRADGLR